MSIRYYGQITKAQDLEKIQVAADKHGKTAVGITKGGGLYALKDGKALKIGEDVAAEHLETTIEEIRKLVESKGSYEIPSKKVEASVGLEEELPEELVEEPVPTPEVEEEVLEEPVVEEPQQEVIEEPVPDPVEEEPVQEEPTPEPEEAPEYIQKVEKAIKDLESKIDTLPGEHDGLLKEVKGLRADLGRFIDKLDKILLD